MEIVLCNERLWITYLSDYFLIASLRNKYFFVYFCRNKCFYFSRAWLTVADLTVVLHGLSDWYNKNQNLLSSIQTVPWTKHSSIVTCLHWRCEPPNTLRFDPIICRIIPDQQTLLTPGDSILSSVGYRLTNGHP